MFKRLFGGSEGASRPPQPIVGTQSTVKTVDAIQTLGDTEELLTKRRDLLERKVQVELDRAKEFLRQNNKRAALMAMKKKKLYEAQLEQVENNILRVTEQQNGLEGLRVTAETMNALRTGAHAQKATMAEMKIDDVDRVLDEINEQTDQMRQIQEAMGQPIGAAADIDEDELLGELEEMEAAQLDATALETAKVPAYKVPSAAAATAAAEGLPSVPTTRPQQQQQQKLAPQKTPEELELEQLAAEMAS